MRRYLAPFLFVAALWPVAVWSCPDGGCDWDNPNVTFTLTEENGALSLSSVVQGCQGMRMAHQETMAREIEKARKGETCDECPFGVQGLLFKLEKTELGVLVKIEGPKEKLALFKDRFDRKLRASGAGGDGKSCGCKATCPHRNADGK